MLLLCIIERAGYFKCSITFISQYFFSQLISLLWNRVLQIPSVYSPANVVYNFVVKWKILPDMQRASVPLWVIALECCPVLGENTVNSQNNLYYYFFFCKEEECKRKKSILLFLPRRHRSFQKVVFQGSQVQKGGTGGDDVEWRKKGMRKL